MDISHTVAHKLRNDRELLDMLRNADPSSALPRHVLLTLADPDIGGGVSGSEGDPYSENMAKASAQAGKELSSITGLKVHNLMESLGYASVSGTAEALVRALELECVKAGIIADRQTFRVPRVG